MRAIILLGVVAASIPAAVASAQVTFTSPTRVTVPLAGDRRQPGLFAERIKFLAGDRGRPHKHSGELHVTILSGRLFFNWGTRFDTTGARSLVPGEFLVIPPGKAHFEWVSEPSEIHVEGVGPVSTAYVDSLGGDAR